MTTNTPSVEETKAELEDEVSDFDESEFEEKMEEHEERLSQFGDDDFVAWAVAYVEYGVKIDADFALPGNGGGGGGGGGGVPDDLEVVDLDDIDTIGDDDQVTVRGYVLGSWEGTTSEGNPKHTLRLIDETAIKNVSAYSDDAVENMQSVGLEIGEYVEINAAGAFSFEGDDGEQVYMCSVPYWAEFDTDADPDFELKDISKDHANEITNLGDFVYIEGLVTDTNFTEYEGCANCMKSYDPDETRVCPGCGQDEMKTYEPGSIQVTNGSTTATVSFSPSDVLDIEDPLMSHIRAFGEFVEDEYNETTYKQIDVVTCELMEEPPDTSSDPVEEEVREEGDDEVTDEDIEEMVDESSNGDVDDERIDKIEEKVIDFGREMPAMVGVRVLDQSFGIDDEEEQVEIMTKLRDLDTVDVDEDDGSIEDGEWQKVMLEKAG